MANHFLTSINPKHAILRHEFQKALSKIGFIEDLWDEESVLVEETKSAKYHSVEITDLQDEKVKGIWKVNLEQQIDGISTSGKTPEVALLVLKSTDSN